MGYVHITNSKQRKHLGGPAATECRTSTEAKTSSQDLNSHGCLPVNTRSSFLRITSTSSTITARGIIKARRIYCCSQPATSYLSPSARCAPVNGLAGCYVSTIGKPHEYFDLTTSGCAVSLPVARPAADLSQPCAPPVGLSLATRSPGVGSQPCGAKYPRFCADSKGV